MTIRTARERRRRRDIRKTNQREENARQHNAQSDDGVVANRAAQAVCMARGGYVLPTDKPWVIVTAEGEVVRLTFSEFGGLAREKRYGLARGAEMLAFVHASSCYVIKHRSGMSTEQMPVEEVERLIKEASEAVRARRGAGLIEESAAQEREPHGN